MHLIGLAVVVIIVAALYRRIESIRVLTTVLWVIMLVTVATVIVACFSHFSPHLAFGYPPGAFRLSSRFFAGVGAAGSMSTSRPPACRSGSRWPGPPAGVLAFLGWARFHRSWPFAPVQVDEAYLREQRAGDRETGPARSATA
jgi:hypothetical protein